MQFPDKYKRRYQCFVCGLEYETIKEFAEHILEKHEEGREYVKCQVQHCQLPVRDLRIHYKALHPQAPLPKNGLLKALVWKDFKGGKRRSKKPNFKEGWHTSYKMDGKKFYYRSSYEKAVIECLEEWTNILAFEVEPFKIPYLHNGTQHNYTPDMFVKYTDGTTEIWEVKPSNQTSLEKNQDKWHAANELCKSRGWNFVVMNERKIRELQQIVTEQFNQ